MNVLHAHLWGSPWTDNMGIYILTPDVCEQMLEIIEDEKDVNAQNMWPHLWNFVHDYIKKCGPTFFKLSGASPKDAGFPLKAVDAQYVFDVCFKSLRFLEELANASTFNYDIALILQKWNNDIEQGDEYRVLVDNGQFSLAIGMKDCKLADENVSDWLRKYIDEHVHLFPSSTIAVDLVYKSDSSIIFVEFNPIDDELDLYNINLEILSHNLRCEINKTSATMQLIKNLYPTSSATIT